MSRVPMPIRATLVPEPDPEPVVEVRQSRSGLEWLGSVGGVDLLARGTPETAREDARAYFLRTRRWCAVTRTWVLRA